MQIWLKNIGILFFISILINGSVYGQETPVKKDSTMLYRDIEAFSKKSRFNKFVYRLIFKPVPTEASQKKKAKKRVYKKLIQKPYSNFEGKIIRQISIETLDPFGYSINDTSVKPQKPLVIAGDKLHIKTRSNVIRNMLLFNQNQKFDSLLVKESERLVRASSYVLDVSFNVKAIQNNSDSVDILIREIDKWSLIPRFELSSSNISFNITDKNFLGSGHESNNDFKFIHTSDDFAYNLKYTIRNIRATYIDATLNFSEIPLNNANRSFAFDRKFFSPFTKWAGGASFSNRYHYNHIHTDDSVLISEQFKFNTQDYWAGSAIHLFKVNTETKGNTNFISTARFLRIRYIEKPVELFDKRDVFSNENLYLASIGISTRKYVQDKYIFKHGITEDIPIGKVFSLTGGYQIKNSADRLYLGARISFGNYYPWGYLSSNFEYGSFFRSSHSEQGIFSTSVIYFTGLMELGKWKFRQFIKPQVDIGINRFPSDTLTLNDGNGMDGFNSPSLAGTSRLLLTAQTQFYAPWNLIGFHFAPFLIISLGMLGDPSIGFKNKVYSQISLGVLIKNENLLINTFQISLAYYPLIPGKGKDILKINSIKTTDFEYRDFEIGKPSTKLFQ